MPVAERSRERVQSRIATFEETYDSFPINQTTLSVSAAAYRRARERCHEGTVDAYVRIHGDSDDVLLVDGDDGAVVPNVVLGPEERLEAGARRAVSEATGVECSVTSLDRVTILGIRNDDDPDHDPVYRLVVVLTGSYVDGTPTADAAWHPTLPETAVPRY